jgi:cytochrome c oxidase assembly factor CtaG
VTETSDQASVAGVDGEEAGVRPTLALLGAVLLVAVLVPPLSTEARRSVAFEALQFALLAVAVPALLTVGAPWRRLGPGSGTAGVDDGNGRTVPGPLGLVDRAATARGRHREPVRSLVYLAFDAAVIVAWRLPPSVDAVARHGWLSVAEALLLVGAGIGLWLELIASPPFVPRRGRPQRIAMAAVAMWTIWVAAYLVGLSHSSVYRAYAHVPGHGLSVSADQAVATGIMWFVSLCAFVPVIFSNLGTWLRSDEDPDDALFRLIRDGRRRQQL